jgi:hypothetical protein
MLEYSRIVNCWPPNAHADEALAIATFSRLPDNTW